MRDGAGHHLHACLDRKIAELLDTPYLQRLQNVGAHFPEPLAAWLRHHLPTCTPAKRHLIRNLSTRSANLPYGGRRNRRLLRRDW